jgi:hypothetical protein
MAERETPAVVQATLRRTRLDMTMYYAHSRKKQKLEAQGRVLEAVLGGERGLQRGRRQFSSKIVGRELVYNDELTAS